MKVRFVLMLALCATLCGLCANADGVAYNVYRQGLSYGDYLKSLPSHDYATEPVTLEGAKGVPDDGAVTAADGGALVWQNDDGTVTWSLKVLRGGLYEAEVTYLPLSGNGVSIERSVLIDGKLPYNEARGVMLTRRWARASDRVRRDNQGNDIRPSLVEQPAIMSGRLYASSGLYAAPLAFYLTEGEHTFSLAGLREPVRILSIRLEPPEALKSYARPEGDVDGSLPLIKLQGEEASAVSDQTLYPIADQYNSMTEPFEMGLSRLNYIGAYNWRQTGQWIEWTYAVDTPGYYKIMLRAQQNYLVGLPVTRRILLDGKVPCSEMESVGFPYASEWYGIPLSCGGEAMLFYLDRGEHTLRMEVTLGGLAETVGAVRQTAADLTTLYGKVIMITGTVPDMLRDYQLEKRIVGIGDELNAAAAQLREQVAAIEALAGGPVAEAQALTSMAVQLASLAADPDTLPSRLDNFRENLSTLSSWILSITEQPLDIDYIVLAGADYKLPSVNPNFGRKTLDAIQSFFISFTKDYTNLGDVYDPGKAVTVWAALGQEQAATLKALIDEKFTPDTGIPVNLNILSSTDAMLYAASEDNPPDVVIGTGGSLPVDYGIRTALIDLTSFKDFADVASQFYPSALTEFTYEGAVYALPISQTFPVLFYRTDIFDALGLSVPQTWDDVYALIAHLQEKNLTMGPGGFFDMFLFQSGGRYYSDDNTECLLASPQGIEAFERYTELYTNYGLPQEYDFYNRLRTGEMPIGIADFSMYNTLAVAAPEIKGLWSVAPVPGTPKPDGSIDRSVSGSSSACVMFAGARHKDDGWRFLKWFLSADTQVAYGREIEAVLGSGARYASANRKAMDGLSWPEEIYSVIREQWTDVVGIPVIPGSYYVSRHLGNAFREVVSMGALPREAILKYVDLINSEIRKKREEFGLPVSGEAVP